MATVCVGCGLEVSAEGKLQIAMPTTVHETVGSGTLSYPGPTDVSPDEAIAVGPELTVQITNPSDCRDMLVHTGITMAAHIQIGSGMAGVFLRPAGASQPFPIPGVGVSLATGDLEYTGVMSDASRRVGVDVIPPGETYVYVGQAYIDAPTGGNIPMPDGGLSVRVPEFLWSISLTGWLI